MAGSRDPKKNSRTKPIDRRRFFQYFSGIGAASTLFAGTLWSRYAASEENGVTVEMIRDAEWAAGVSFTDEERKLMTSELNEQIEMYGQIRALNIPNSVPPALRFDPVLPGMTFDREENPFKISRGAAREIPPNRDELAFWNVLDLSRVLKARKITSLELTRLYLRRLNRYNPVLNCVVTLTEDTALKQARRADAEIAAGKYRGPLHGIPWGAKDLLATKDHPTTWGAMPFRTQQFEEDATVVVRLEEAGAVLVAKLTLGALAMGDEWFGGRTNSPWNPKRGSQGSSAGPAAAVAAGLVGFAIGSETRGSIVSPATRCGITGFRPTYGRVSRYGAMALCWSMDKLGPMCRSAEDCAIVLNAIHGADEKDQTTVDMPFNWDPDQPLSSLRIGYLKDAFEESEHDAGSLETLRALGVDPIPVELPDFPVDAMDTILMAEAAAAFDELTISGRDDLLVSQDEWGWPNSFRKARLIPAVEYIQANRARTLLMQATEEALQKVDVHITPTEASLALDNLTGHPLVSVPNGFTDDGEPTSIGFLGGLYKDAAVLRVAKAFQDTTDYHLKRPPLDA